MRERRSARLPDSGSAVEPPPACVPAVYSWFMKYWTNGPGICDPVSSTHFVAWGGCHSTLPLRIGCHWLSPLRDLQTNLAAIAVTWCQNDSVAPGYCRRERRKGIIEALDRRVGVQAVRLDRGQELLGPETERRLGAVKRPARLMVQNHHKKQNLPWETLRALSRARTDRLAKSLHSPTVTWGSVAPPLQK